LYSVMIGMARDEVTMMSVSVSSLAIWCMFLPRHARRDMREMYIVSNANWDDEMDLDM